MNNLNSWSTWAHGLVGGMIGSAASSLSGALALPGVFNLSHEGLQNMGRLALLPALVTAFAYLKQSPLPTVSTTVTQTTKIEETKQ